MKNKSSRDILLAEVELFLEDTGMGQAYLGLCANRNGHVVERLRAGTDVYTGTADALRAFMLEYRGRGTKE